MPPSARGGVLLRVGVGVTAALTVVGASLLLPTNGAVVRALADDPALASRTGLPREEALALAEEVRVHVLGGGPKTISDPRFGPREVEHLEDVRVALRTRWLALPAGLALACALALARDRRRDVALALVWAGTGLLLALGAALAVGLADFDTLFTAFHGLFFAPGTWTFGDSDLIIRLFPLRFWVTEGALWGGSAALGAAAMAAAGWILRSDRSSERD